MFLYSLLASLYFYSQVFLFFLFLFFINSDLKIPPFKVMCNFWMHFIHMDWKMICCINTAALWKAATSLCSLKVGYCLVKMDINKQVLKWLGNKSFWLLKVIAHYFSQNYFDNAAHIFIFYF